MVKTALHIPNQQIVEAIEKLGGTVTLPQVVNSTGLEVELVEAEMGTLLSLSKGFFKISSDHQGLQEISYVAQTFDTEHVQYVYPAKLQNFLRQQFLLVRLRAIGASIAAACFAVLRVSFGIILILSLAVVIVLVVFIMTRGGGHDQRSRDAPLPTVIRHIGGTGGSNRARHFAGISRGDCYGLWYWWQTNPFFNRHYGQAQYNTQPPQPQDRQRIMADFDEEAMGRTAQTRRRTTHSVGSHASSTSSSASSNHSTPPDNPHGPVQSQCVNTAHTQGQDGEEGEEMGFLETVFSLLFGDGPPGPSEAERWRVIAGLVYRQQGVVVPEEIYPLLYDVDEEWPDRAMVDVLGRFGGGKPLVVQDCGIVYDIPRMREGRPGGEMVEEGVELEQVEMVRLVEGNPVRSLEVQVRRIGLQEGMLEPEVTHGLLEERKWAFSKAPTPMLQLALALAFCNLVGALYLARKWPLFEGLTAHLVYIVGWVLLVYSLSFLAMPVLRLAFIGVMNRGIKRRNCTRRKFLKEWNVARADPLSKVARKVEWAGRHRQEVCRAREREIV